MSTRFELESRRAALVARCEAQRGEVGVAFEGIERALRPVDTAANVARKLAAQPALAVGVVVVVVLVFRPRQILRFLVWGASTAVAMRRISSLWRGAV